MDPGKKRGTGSDEPLQKQNKLKTKRQKSTKDVVGGSCEGSIDPGENVESENKEVNDSERGEVNKMVDLEKKESIEKKKVLKKCAHEESVHLDTMDHFENQQVSHSKHENFDDSENRNDNVVENGDDSDSKYELNSDSNNEESNESEKEVSNESENDSENEESNDSENEESNDSENEEASNSEKEKSNDSEKEESNENENVDLKEEQFVKYIPKDLLYFDFGTTSFSTESDIIQIGAVRGKKKFNVYVRPNRPNSFRTSRLTRNLRGQADCVGINQALGRFIRFISAKGNGSILVGHYIKNFDCKVLYHAVSNSKELQKRFSSIIKGFIDIHKVFRKVYPELKSYSLDNLFETFIETPRPKRRDALSNSRMTRKLFQLVKSTPETRKSVFSWKSVTCFCSLKPLIKCKALSKYMGRKLAAIELGYDDLKRAYRQSATDGIDSLFSKRVGKHRKAIIEKVSNFFDKHLQI